MSPSFQLLFSPVSQGNETAVGCLSVSICSLFLSQHFPTPEAFGVSSQLNILQSSGVLKDTKCLQLPCTVHSPGTGKSKWVGKHKRAPE